MGWNDNTPVPADFRTDAVHTEVQGIDEVVFNLPFNIIILIYIDLIAGFIGVVREGGQYTVGIVIPGKTGFKIRKEAQDVNFFLGSSFHTEDRDNAETGANFRKRRTVKAGVMIGKGKNLDASRGGSFRQNPRGKVQRTAGRKTGMVMEVCQ
jgi:hypothetical protein